MSLKSVQGISLDWNSKICLFEIRTRNEFKLKVGEGGQNQGTDMVIFNITSVGASPVDTGAWESHMPKHGYWPTMLFWD